MVVDALYERLTFIGCHLSSLVCYGKEVEGGEVGDVVSLAVGCDVAKVAASDDVVGEAAIGHACAFAAPEGAGQVGVLTHHVEIAGESLEFYVFEEMDLVVELLSHGVNLLVDDIKHDEVVLWQDAWEQG